MEKTVAVIRGDGIGPEIVEQALLVLNRVAELFGHEFRYTDVDMGGCAIDKYGDPLPPEMLNKCLASDSVLLGAVGGYLALYMVGQMLSLGVLNGLSLFGVI